MAHVVENITRGRHRPISRTLSMMSAMAAGGLTTQAAKSISSHGFDIFIPQHQKVWGRHVRLSLLSHYLPSSHYIFLSHTYTRAHTDTHTHTPHAHGRTTLYEMIGSCFAQCFILAKIHFVYHLDSWMKTDETFGPVYVMYPITHITHSVLRTVT